MAVCGSVSPWHTADKHAVAVEGFPTAASDGSVGLEVGGRKSRRRGRRCRGRRSPIRYPEDTAMARERCGRAVRGGEQRKWAHDAELHAGCEHVPSFLAEQKLALCPLRFPSMEATECNLVHANSVCESRVLSQFLELAGRPLLDWKSLELSSRILRFLFVHGIDTQDACSVLAHASVYFSDVHAQCSTRMGFAEAGNIMALAVYLAHTYVVDETFALSDWHKHFCMGYCDLQMLNRAILRLLKMRGYILRLPDAQLTPRYGALLHAACGHDPFTASLGL